MIRDYETLLQKDKITRLEIFDDFQEIDRDELDCTVQFVYWPVLLKNNFRKEKSNFLLARNTVISQNTVIFPKLYSKPTYYNGRCSSQSLLG